MPGDESVSHESLPTGIYSFRDPGESIRVLLVMTRMWHWPARAVKSVFMVELLKAKVKELEETTCPRLKYGC